MAGPPTPSSARRRRAPASKRAPGLVTYGELRYHTPADLGIVVLAAVALDHLLRRLRPATV